MRNSLKVTSSVARRASCCALQKVRFRCTNKDLGVASNRFCAGISTFSRAQLSRRATNVREAADV